MVTVACVQINSGPNLQVNLDKIKHYVTMAHSQGAELIALPENVALMAANHHELLAHACSDDSHPLRILIAQLSQQLGVWILIGGLATKTSDSQKLLNRSYLYNAQGELVVHYDKMHLYDVDVDGGESHRESRHYQAGDALVLADMPWGKMGMSICYDVRFPYLYRQLAQHGAFILAVPAAFTYITGEAHWEVLLRARAIETGSFVIAPAQTGSHPANRRTYGHSLIIDPWGRILADAGEGEGIITANIDPALCATVRQQIPSLKNWF